MTYTVTNNAQFNSLEITFDGKPSYGIRQSLKGLHFRWHSVKKCWYGYSTEEEARAAIEGSTEPAEKKAATQPVNRFVVRVGDIFSASWGWEQTNVDFFQVVQLVGACSVRVRQVHPPMISDDTVSGMSSDRTYKITHDLLPATNSSVFIEDQENGDLKRLKSYAADGKSNPLFKLSSFADAYLCTGETEKVYESWYA